MRPLAYAAVMLIGLWVSLADAKNIYKQILPDRDAFVVNSKGPVPNLCPNGDCRTKNFGTLDYLYVHNSPGAPPSTQMMSSDTGLPPASSRKQQLRQGGTADLIRADADSSGSDFSSRMLLSFPLPKLKANESFTVCSLSLPRTIGTGKGILYVKELYNNFDEDTVTFETAPNVGGAYGFFDAAIPTITPVLSACHQAALNLTDRVNLSITPANNQDVNATFSSRESNRIPPRLYVVISETFKDRVIDAPDDAFGIAV
ncbi:hypothetical protein IWQ60_008985 [Tieghemiomyces parasiticus]|uniref:Uncharacterized protein n=1 Tax=Tieghemiomyces parasiticus TaxID=78921 RepID=A0A9W8DQY9_9FUNG|nr:hypothetical protein IWQ60_008985 [Tieghemiomyces parasiticus]